MKSWKRQPVVSAALVIINAIVLVVCMFAGDLLYDKGGLDVFHVLLKKEYARIIWSMFLHADTHHLFSNMILLFFVGAMIEKEVGHVKFALLYFWSGIGGGILSLAYKVMMNDAAMSVGASGAVFGLDGVLLAMALLWREGLSDLTPAKVGLMIVLSLYGGFAGGNIDNAAHVGGLAAGFVGGCIVCLLQRIKHRQSKQIYQ